MKTQKEVIRPETGERGNLFAVKIDFDISENDLGIERGDIVTVKKLSTIKILRHKKGKINLLLTPQKLELNNKLLAYIDRRSGELYVGKISLCDCSKGYYHIPDFSCSAETLCVPKYNVKIVGLVVGIEKSK